MRNWLIVLVFLISPAFAQTEQVTAGSPFGINAGVRFTLMPSLLDGRVYGGVNLFTGGPVSLGGGADLLVSLPLTDLYAGAGLFYASGTTASLFAQGSSSGGLGARGVVGTYSFVCYLTPTPGMSKKRGCYGLQPGAPPLLS